MALAFTFFLLTTTSVFISALPSTHQEISLDDVAISHEDTMEQAGEARFFGYKNVITDFSTRVPLKSRWPNNVIYWEYHPVLNNYTTLQKEFVEKIMAEISTMVCITFSPRTSTSGDTYVSFINNGTGCRADVGYEPNSVRYAHLESNCLNKKAKGTLIHELMHVMGFEHEQTRYDRDLYLKINWENIKSADHLKNFVKYPRQYAFPRYDFDFKSVMMYRLNSFTSDETKDTMQVLMNPNSVNLKDIGDRSLGLLASELDVKRIKSAYSCGKPAAESQALGAEQVPGKYSNFY